MFFLAMVYFCDIRVGLLTIAFAGTAQIVVRSFTSSDGMAFMMRRFLMSVFLVSLIIIIMACIMTYVVQLQKRLRQ